MIEIDVKFFGDDITIDISLKGSLKKKVDDALVVVEQILVFLVLMTSHESPRQTSQNMFENKIALSYLKYKFFRLYIKNINA